MRLFDHNNQPESEWIEVDTANVRVENQLDFGGPWLALELIRKLKLDELLERVMPRGREDIPWSRMAIVLVISRLCKPSSELHIAEHYYEKTAMPDLLGIPSEKVYDQRLYRALDQLLPHKEALEKHLKNRLGTLFNLKYDLLLYDVTSTYFEGQCKSNPLAQRGYSRDKRPDCKQVCIALVVSRCGMPLGYEVFAGNRNDVKTWQEMVTTMEARYGKAERIWCGDRREKEKATHDRFEQRIDGALEKIQASCRKRTWTKETIDRRVGKIMAKNSRAAGLFEVEVKAIEGRASISWKKNQKWRDWATLSEGCYLLRTNVTNWSAEDLWQAYIQLTEAEAAFRIHKSDLRIRPVWHQREDRVLGHILVCFLAYVLWKTLHQMTKAAGLGDEPRRIFEELGKISVVDVVLLTRDGVEIRRRCICRPTDHQAILLDRLGLTLPRQLTN